MAILNGHAPTGGILTLHEQNVLKANMNGTLTQLPASVKPSFRASDLLPAFSINTTIPHGSTSTGLIMTDGTQGHAPQSDFKSGIELKKTYEASLNKATVESDALADSPTIQIADAPIHALNPLPNPLHAYPSYTYGISLHALSAIEYNDVVKSPKSYRPKHVLIASAGRRDNIGGTFPRSEFFNEDFYFTNLNMTTVIGLNARSRATNAITVNFSINEPYGITLLNRIIDVADSLSTANYIDMPYLLQIDFFGINDAGEIVGIIPGHTKYIPIKLIKMENT